MVARELRPDSSGSGNCNSECDGLLRLVKDLEVLDRVMGILKIDPDDPRRLPADWDATLTHMSIDEITGLLERVVLHYLASRSRPK